MTDQQFSAPTSTEDDTTLLLADPHHQRQQPQQHHCALSRPDNRARGRSTRSKTQTRAKVRAALHARRRRAAGVRLDCGPRNSRDRCVARERSTSVHSVLMPDVSLPQGSWRITHEIVTETRRGNSISNEQQFLFAPQEQNAARDLRAKFPAPTFVHRTSPNPIYNCHGMTFAARRTAIFESETVRQIIADDCYESVAALDVLPGDVVLYVSDDSDVEHSGIVIRSPRGLEPPLICSKWGKAGEIIHPVNRSPYTTTVTYEYYRVTR